MRFRHWAGREEKLLQIGGFGIALLLVTLSIQVMPVNATEKAAPLVIGETFTLASKILGETRRINVYLPPGYAESPQLRVPVLYMPDGGLAEDFLHVAGLVQVSVGNGTMRPFLLVGIENTERRRDLTGPTDVAEERLIAPRVGGSERFRRFLREDLMPQVKERYRTTQEAAIVGESLAGDVEEILLERYRRMTPGERLVRAFDMSRAVQQLALARIRAEYGPALSEREERLRLASLWLPRETMIEVFGWDPEIEGY
jgi:hypothetical protein